MFIVKTLFAILIAAVATNAAAFPQAPDPSADHCGECAPGVFVSFTSFGLLYKKHD